MKTEPESFGIDDLARVQVEPWTGVRNYQARNFMRDGMTVGDPVLFYHSSCEPPGVAGLARVVREKVVDATQFDASSKYYDPDSPEGEPRWICVDVAFVEKLPRLVPLEELRGNERLDGMVLLARSRLSVQPVSEAHYEEIVKMARANPKPSPKPSAKPSPKAKPSPSPKAKPSASPKPASKKAGKAASPTRTSRPAPKKKDQKRK